MKSNQQSDIQAKKFQSYHRIWVQTSNQYQACDWMAAHIGRLVAKVEQLEKQVKKHERKLFPK